MNQPVYRTVQNRMRQGEKIAHAVLIMCTAGFWFPFYWARKRSIERVTTTYAARSR